MAEEGITRRGLLAASLGGAAAFAAQEQAGWKAGAARAVVTPQESIWMAGYAARNKPSEGVLKDLYVRALALEDERGAKAVVLASDVIGLRRELADAIAARCEKQFGLARDRLLLNSSHTHTGPALGRFTPPPGYEEQAQVVARYTESLLDKVVETIGAAMRDAAPATLHFSQGLAGFAVNRRRDRPGMRHLPAPVDHDVPVLAVRRPDGALAATVFGYACHNTTLGQYRISGDYAGFAQEALEKAHPKSYALFVTGCAADANPLPRYQGTDPALAHYSEELAAMYGKILAAAVDIVLHGKMAPVAGPLRTAFERVDLPFQPPPAGEERTGPASYPCPVQVLRFGSGLKLIALAGEVVVDYSLRLKAQHGWEDTWVAAYSNDMPGYIPSVRVLREGGYETRGGPGGLYAEAVEELLVEKVNGLVQQTA
jgi:neutral ceramidase